MASEEKPSRMETPSKEYTERTSHLARAHTNGWRDQSTKESFIKEIGREWASSTHPLNSSTEDNTEMTDLKANVKSSCRTETLITAW